MEEIKKLQEAKKLIEKQDQTIGASKFHFNFLRLLFADDSFSHEMKVKIKNLAMKAETYTDYEIGYKAPEERKQP